jgi:hypothetical protein
MSRIDTSPRKRCDHENRGEIVTDASPDHERLSKEPSVTDEGEWHASTQDAICTTWGKPHAKKTQCVEHQGHGQSEAETNSESAQRFHQFRLDTAAHENVQVGRAVGPGRSTDGDSWIGL